jgi:hypothetical protein
MLEHLQFPSADRDKLELAEASIHAANRSLNSYFLRRKHDQRRLKLLLERSRKANREYLELVLNMAKTDPFAK